MSLSLVLGSEVTRMSLSSVRVFSLLVGSITDRNLSESCKSCSEIDLTLSRISSRESLFIENFRGGTGEEEISISLDLDGSITAQSQLGVLQVQRILIGRFFFVIDESRIEPFLSMDGSLRLCEIS